MAGIGLFVGALRDNDRFYAGRWSEKTIKKYGRNAIRKLYMAIGIAFVVLAVISLKYELW